MAHEVITKPWFPIVYLRGYAATQGAVEEAVGAPYTGFNLGSTKLRQNWRGRPEKYIFEGPLVRFMKEYGYRDAFEGGRRLPAKGPLSPKSLIVYPYYDQVSESFQDDPERQDMETYAEGLSDLILQVRDLVCGGDRRLEARFKLYLVAHSMGGLICRCLLQNPHVGNPEAKQLVDKVFTYGTPHGGIDFKVLGNVPGVFSINNSGNFNRGRMREYLALPEDSQRVNTLAGSFPDERFFCLVGTDHRDFEVAGGWPRRLVGPASDGLVRCQNAYVQGAPRAYVFRSHSGDLGLVNSEEGYQNLVRFLFGDVRVDGRLKVEEISLPPAIQRAFEEGRQIRASYHFETALRVRGARYHLHRRLVAEESAIFRTFDELLRPERAGRGEARSPHLFSQFLSIEQRTRKSGPLVFSLDLAVRVPEYEIDGFLFFDQHIEGSYLYRETLTLAACPPEKRGQSWRLRYGLDSRTPCRATREVAAREQGGQLVFPIPVISRTRPGLKGTLAITVSPW